MSCTKNKSYRRAAAYRHGVLPLVISALTTRGIAAQMNSAAATDQSIQVYIASQPLPDALTVWASQTGVKLLYHPEDISAAMIAPKVSGAFTPDKALTEILDSTGLSFYHVNPTTIAIRPMRSEVHRQNTRLADASPATTAKDSLSSGSASTPGSGQVIRTADKIETEVIVTAQKREERLQDVPVPVTAISGETLVQTDNVRVQDYYTRVPGLSLSTSESTGAPFLAIRGITTGGYTNPTVAVVVDDVPFGSSSALVWGYDIPDFDPSDLASVEVLRGPQGTLYGASSLGGLVKLVTVDPSTERMSGFAQAGFDSVHHGDEPGYTFRGSVNVPLWETLAVRASGFVRRDPGYINNIETGQEGVNENESEGGRLAALWRPMENVSLKVSALIQHSDRDGSPYSDVKPDYSTFASNLGDLEQSAARDTGFLRKQLEAYSATLHAKLGGGVELTNVTGYSINRFTASVDYSGLFGSETLAGVPAAGFAGFGVPGTPAESQLSNKKFTEELRLSGPIGEHFDWLAGAFFDHEVSNESQYLNATDPVTGVVVGQWLHDVDPSRYKEYAGFTDLTYHFTDQFDLQVGGRASHIEQSYSEIFIGIPYDTVFLGTASPFLYPNENTSENAFTYLVTPRFKVSPDLMVYARLASGYRPGGPNVNASSFGLPTTYSHDTTKNFEFGTKADVLDKTLSFDASLYYIDWNDIQLALFNAASGQNYNANGGRAKSQGVELSVDYRPTGGLRLNVWGSYNDAELTSGFPTASTAYGVAGDRLPYSSKFSGNLTIEDSFPITGGITGSVGGGFSYVGDRYGVFTSTPERQILPGYTQTDLHAGLAYETWNGMLFINNLTDRRGVLAGGLGTYLPNAFNYIQPRTVGLNVSKAF